MDKFDKSIQKSIKKRKMDNEDFSDTYDRLFDIEISKDEARKRLKGIENYLKFKEELANKKSDETIEKEFTEEEELEYLQLAEEVVEIKKRKYIPKIYKNNNSNKMAILSGDKHFCYEDKDAIDILKQICEDYSEFIDEFIDGGDGINNNALSKFISTEKEQFTLYQEVKAFEEHLWEMKKILPKTKFVIVEDNHYHLRKKNFLAENPSMVGMLKDVDFPFDEQSPHGVPYFPFNQSRIGVIHGLSTSDNFTKAHSNLFKEDIINFHTHGSQHYTCKNGSKALNKQAQKMWGMPSMCIQMDYVNGSPSRSNTGFGILWYNADNDIYDLQYVFIENGKAIYNGKLYTSRKN